MNERIEQEQNGYYVSRRLDILEVFDGAAQRWRVVLSRRYGDGFAETVLHEARERFESLIPAIPYIGGDENHLTGSLIRSVRCLAFYRAMEARGRPAEETGKVLYDAIKAHPDDFIPQIPPSQRLSRDELMRRRRERAERSRERTYAWDWVYEFVEGDGEAFDYGYDFVECATEKFYRALGAEEFLPFYCFLDFPMCELGGLGLSRTMTLGEGHERCDFRFKGGGKAELAWPPPFLKRDACERQSQGGFSDPQVARLESEVAGRTVEGVGSGGIARWGSVKCQNNEISSEPGWQSSPVASIQLLEKKSEIK